MDYPDPFLIHHAKVPIDVAIQLHPPRHIDITPPDVLINIFEYFQREGWMELPIPTLERIIAVCGHWRAVALGAPHLWSYISLYAPQEMHISLVQRWLERSKTSPLTVGICQPYSSIYDSEPPTTDKATSEILRLLLPHIHRWRSLEFSTERSTTVIPKLPLSPTAAPLLESLNIGGTALTLSTTRNIWEAIGTYPSLRRVTWSTALDLGTLLSDLPNFTWRRLTHLTGAFAVDDTLLDLLMQCTCLESFQLLDIPKSNHSGVVTPRAPFVMPALRVLSLKYRDDARLLDFLVLPNLQESALNSYGYQQFHSWLALFERSSCTLTNVHMNVPRLHTSEKDSMHAFLSSTFLSKVAVLHAHERWGSDILVQMLTLRPGETILPSLQRLHLSVNRYKTGSLEAMIKSRIGSPDSRLVFVDILDLSDHSEDGTDARFIKQLRQDGHDVSIHR